MDATRARRTRDRARQKWYARYRQQRFARFLGFAQGAAGQAAAPVGRAAREYINNRLYSWGVENFRVPPAEGVSTPRSAWRIGGGAGHADRDVNVAGSSSQSCA